MEQWLRISMLLCLFGFLKELRPSEPYIFDYLTGPWRNLTDTQITEEVYPVGVYANLILLILVFLITDICRYKPLIIVLGMSGVIVWSLLSWTTTLFALQIVEVFYGIFMATEVAYYTYIYAKVDAEHYQKVTSHTRGALLAGRAISGALCQSLVTTNTMDYKQLNYITVSTVSLATIWGVFLPSVNRSIYFHTDDSRQLRFSQKISSAFILMRNHLISAYSNMYVMKWSLWWALASCGYRQIETYMQPLYSAIQDSNEATLNGAVEASLTLLGSCAALLTGFIKVNWKSKGDLTLALFSLIQGVLLVVASQTSTIYLCYAFYILFAILFHFMVTVASAQIAENINQDSYGFIFGVNTFISLGFNSILTAAVATDGIGFHLPVRDQFVVYGGYQMVISSIFIVIGLRTCLVKGNNSEKISEGRKNNGKKGDFNRDGIENYQ